MVATAKCEEGHLACGRLVHRWVKRLLGMYSRFLYFVLSFMCSALLYLLGLRRPVYVVVLPGADTRGEVSTVVCAAGAHDLWSEAESGCPTIGNCIVMCFE